MPFTRYRTQNNAKGTLLASIASTGATTFSVQSGQGARFPSVYPYLLTIEERDSVAPYAVLKREMVKVTNRATDTFTVTRSAGTCLPSDSSSTPGTTAYTFTNPSSTTVSLAVSSEVIEDIQAEIANKLSSVWGLRTGLTANALMTTNGSGAEQAQAMTTDSSFISTDEILKRTAWGSWVRTPYSVLSASLNTTNNPVLPAWETLTAGDFVYQEDMVTTYLLCTAGAKTTVELIGNVSANTRKSMRIIGNGVGFTTMKLGVYKTGTPADNFEVRIETDDGTGKPSGTAVTNGTASVAGWSLTTSVADTTFTFGGTVTLTTGVVYHIVVRRSSGLDVSNYFNMVYINKNVRAFTTRVFDGTNWWSAVTTKTMYATITGAYYSVACETSASFIEQSYFMGQVTSSFAVWAQASILKIGVSRTLTGLTKNAGYFLSNTAGAISTTPGTIIRQVWFTDDRTDAIYIIPQEDNVTFSDTNNAVYTTFYTGSSFLWKADFAGTLFVTLNVSGSSNLQLFKNGTAIRNLTGFGSATTDTVTVVPGDVIFAYSNTSTVVIQTVTRLQPVGRYLAT